MINLEGKIFSNLVVISFDRLGKNRHPYWWCKCLLCNNIKSFRKTQLINKEAISCGCYKLSVLNKYKFKKKLPPGVAAFNSLLNAYKMGAKKRGRIFALTAEQFLKFTQLNCSYCGSPPSQVHKIAHNLRSEYTYTGVDRIDNNVDYTLDNCKSCCSNCNRSKYMLSEQDFKNHVEKMYNFMFKGNS
jgi:5-methylcytosine-specific restriction endonuclease McrA